MFTLRGKLYEFDKNRFMSDIRYRLLGEGSARPWGELIPVEYKCLNDGENYIVKLENNRKIKCNLRKHVAGAAGFPANFVYRFTATSPVTWN